MRRRLRKAKQGVGGGGVYRAVGLEDERLEAPGPTAVYPRITQPAWPWISEESTYYGVALKFASSSGSDSELRRRGINDLAAIDQVISGDCANSPFASSSKSLGNEY